MPNCKLNLGFFEVEADQSLVSLAGFHVYSDTDGSLYSSGQYSGHDGDKPKLRVIRAIAEGYQGVNVLMNAIRYAEEERTGYTVQQAARSRQLAAESELRTAQIESAIQKRILAKQSV